MASITSLGVGSGLPLQTTLDSLASFEKQRLNPIAKQQSDNTARKTAFETLKTTLSNFQTVSDDLNKSDLFSTTKSSSTDPSITVTTTPGAAPGKYKIEVTNLAQAQSLATATQTSTKDAMGDSDATITIKQSGKESLKITLEKGKTSLEDIRDAINEKEGGVSASIVKVKEGEYKLVLNATETGIENSMTITVTGNADLEKTLSYDGTTIPGTDNIQQLVEPQNAKLTVNGISIERPTNTITDAPQGVTLTLTKETKDAVVTISKNTDDVKTAVKKWVNSYNALLDTIGTLTKYTPVDPGAKAQAGDNGVLLGDSTVMSITSKIRAQFIQLNNNSGFKTLAEIGISTTDYKTGKLTLDEKKLDKVLIDNPTAVSHFLTGDGKNPGVMGSLSKLLNEYTSSTGTISGVERNIAQRDIALKRQYDQTNNNINDTIARYKKQFTDLDVLVKKMDGVSKYLSQQFDALTANASK